VCILFICEQGIVSIKKESRRIYAEKDEKGLFEVSAVCLMGNRLLLV